MSDATPTAPPVHPWTEEVMRAIGRSSSPLRRAAWLGSRLLVAIALLAAVAVGVRAWRRKAANAPMPYVTTQVTRGDVRVTVTATGTLEALTTVTVGAEVTGRALQVNVDANDIVKKGMVLALIDPEQLQAAVDQAAAQVVSSDAAIAQAKATVAESTLALVRRRALLSQGLASESDVEGAVANRDRAQANLQSASANATLNRAALKLARSKLDKATIVSPIDGVVMSRSVEPGQTITAGFTTPVLFKLAQDLKQMRLNVDVDEADVGRVKAGMSASFTVQAYPDKTFTSQVIVVRNEPTTSSNVVTYKAVLSVDNVDGLLRPGMTCTAIVLAEDKRDVALLPNAALRFEPLIREGPDEKPTPTGLPPGTLHVWTMRGRDLVAIAVKTGASDGTSTELVSGDLPTGAAIVTDVQELP